MLFWAGLRGAVGFALSAGIEGQNAIALQTTVLVAVVLTVIIFGGTTAQMLQILGIRTGVVDNEDSSDEEEFGDGSSNGFGDAHGMRNVKRRTAPYRRTMSRTTSRLGQGKWEDRESTRPLRSSYRNASTDDLDASRGSSPSPYNHQSLSAHNAGRMLATAPPDMTKFSAQYELDEDEEDDDASSSHSGEVLPAHSPLRRMTSASVDAGDGSGDISGASEPAIGPLDLEEARQGSGSARQLLDRAGLIMRDGQWFQRIDVRYLLPMFSNSVANRKAEAKKKGRILQAQAAALSAAAEAVGEQPKNVGGAGASSEEVFFGERDADVVDEEEEDDSTTLPKPLDAGAASTSSSVRGAFAP